MYEQEGIEISILMGARQNELKAGQGLDYLRPCPVSTFKRFIDYAKSKQRQFPQCAYRRLIFQEGNH